MKKTLNINLAGYPFTIDEDAYNLLKDYLDTIRYAFETKDDSGEIASDIESRIAELLFENQQGTVRIVTFDEISKVIERIGQPSDFIEIEDTFKIEDGKPKEEIKIETGPTPPPYVNPNFNFGNHVKKKLYRDPQDSMLGGVCSGFAAYLNVDPTIVRLVTVVLFFLSATTVAIAYIILWLVVPEAKTPLQRMQMLGQDPTVENIGKSVTENFQGETNPNEAEPSKKRNGAKRFISNVFSIFVKIIVILCLFIGIPVLLLLLFVLFACVVGLFASGVSLFGETDLASIYGNQSEALPLFTLLASIGAIITIGIPTWLMIRMIFKKKEAYISTNTRRSLMIIWLGGIAMTAVFTVKTVKSMKRLDFGTLETRIERLQQLEDLDIDDGNLESVNISKEGISVKDKAGKSVVINNEGISITETAETLPNDSIQVRGDTIQEQQIILTDSIN